MKVLVIGKNGQLGQSMYQVTSNKHSNHQFVYVGRDDLDLSRASNITKYFQTHHFDVVVNCAAYTAVDKAESNEALADRINHTALYHIATIANKQQVKLIHISTDFVFDGKNDNPYRETDAVRPINVYGRTKLEGEQAILEVMPMNAIIVRTSWVYSEYGNNFVKTILKLGTELNELGVVCDQIGTPTYARDLALTILRIIKHNEFIEPNQKTQIYHYSNQGACSWYDFAKKIIEFSNITCKIKPITTEDYPLPARRPVNTLMNKNKIIKKFGLKIPLWQDSLKLCIRDLKKQSNHRSNKEF